MCVADAHGVGQSKVDRQVRAGADGNEESTVLDEFLEMSHAIESQSPANVRGLVDPAKIRRRGRILPGNRPAGGATVRRRPSRYTVKNLLQSKESRRKQNHIVLLTQIRCIANIDVGNVGIG